MMPHRSGRIRDEVLRSAMTSGPPDISRQSPAASPAAAMLTSEEFARRFREASRALWCIAASVCRERSAAEDAVQEAAIIAMSKLREFDPQTSFIAWMGQIVRYVALNDGRKSARRQTLLRDGVNPPTASENTESWGLGPELTAALQTLDPTARACLLLRVVGEMSYDQIAAALGIPEGTAMSHVFRARKAMSQRLKPMEGGAA